MCEMSELNSNGLSWSHHAYKYCCPLVSSTGSGSHHPNPVAVCLLCSCPALVGSLPSDTAICFPLCNGVSLRWLRCGSICRLEASPPTANRSRHLHLIEQLLRLERKQNKETCHGFSFFFFSSEKLLSEEGQKLKERMKQAFKKQEVLLGFYAGTFHSIVLMDNI